MPSLDGENRVVGCVAREVLETGYYVRSYLVLDFSNHKLRMYPEESEASAQPLPPPQVEINCQYITKVRASLTRPKSLNSLEIVTTSGSHFLSVDSLEERDQWAESLKKASMRQGTVKQVTSLMKQKEQDVSYKNKIVGGVVQKIPIQTSEPAHRESPEPRALSGGASVGERRTRGFPRIIKAGHGTKIGHVRKNWKKRFFVLTEIALAYYKSIEEVEPIRAVPVAEITAVHVTNDSGKDQMEVVTPSRTFLVQFDSSSVMEDWVAAFTQLLTTVKPTLPAIHTVSSSSSPTDTLSLDSNDIAVGTLV